MTIDGGPSGNTIERFKPLERFGHWCLAGSFIMLAITGYFCCLVGLYLFQFSVMKQTLPSRRSQSGFITISLGFSWRHWYWIFVMWVAHNIPNKLDLVWLAKGGGIIGNAHPTRGNSTLDKKSYFG